MRRGRLSRRGLLGGAILVLWVGLMGWQARTVYLQPEMTRLAEATRGLDPGTHFYAVRMGGEVVGMASSRLDTVPEGFLLEDRLNLELQAMAQEGMASAVTTVRLTPTLQMTDFTFELGSDAGRFVATGRVEGDSLLTVVVEAGGQPQEVSFRLTEPPISASVLPIRIAQGGQLQVGRTVRYPVFDPSTVSTRQVEVEILERDTLVLPDSAARDPGSGRWAGAGHRSVTAWRLKESYGGITVESWIDEDGRVLRSSSPTGLSLERVPFELVDQERSDARAAGGGGRPGSDVVFSTAIASNVDLSDAGERDALRFVLSGVALGDFDLEGGRQELRGDTLTVRREALDELEPGFRLPYPRMDLSWALSPEPLIQSGDERIRRAAETAVRPLRGQRNDPVAVARRLNEAVYRMLDKEMAFSLPSALQVLETRAGDCNEHTVLYVALARALGLPARMAVGLVHLEGSFFYHAWPEVWLGEWVAMDPTLGQSPADATHLRFLTGSLAQQVEVARLIGNLRIEVLE